MKKRYKFNVIAAILLVGLMTTPCLVLANQDSSQTTTVTSMSTEQAKTVYKGKINGVSKKATSIMITVGKGEKAKTVILKFDDKTKGIDLAKKGAAAIITYEIIGQDKVARIIKPKLAKLPTGVTEMQPEELVSLVNMAEQGKTKYLLVDSRPASRFAKGHIPTSVSLPVTEFKKLARTLLPEDKDFPLIYHCGGST